MLAAAALVPAAPAQAADPVPEGPVRMYLKDHEDLPLAQQDGAIRLTAEADLWTLRPVEALQDLGEYQIVHDGDGKCLSTDTSGGGETAPVFLAECSGADAWTVIFDDVPSNSDFRFITTDDYYLGLAHDADAVEGAEVVSVALGDGASPSRHFQEWLFAAVPPETPSPSPSEEVSSSEAPSTTPAAAQPQLPTTGAGLGAAIGAGAVALAGGAALVLWWQRRRALRGQW
ncbi:LPXTG cell wall anchor domain-containing protein [Glycomyces sp. NPDC047010]|uniref:RICIN domain-containing protein n=1 Tax=Glycomyces sp. NPDC047010 TaxID=3155023 RepID=UPI0033CF05FD